LGTAKCLLGLGVRPDYERRLVIETRNPIKYYTPSEVKKLYLIFYRQIFFGGSTSYSIGGNCQHSLKKRIVRDDLVPGLSGEGERINLELKPLTTRHC
jgi:hypothetical protein